MDEAPRRATASFDHAVAAWNVDGSSDARPESGSWLRDAERATGRRRGRCSFDGCRNQAEVGGHVWIKKQGCFIAPICRPCNRFDNRDRMQGAGARLRAHTEVTPAAVTKGMRSAERRRTPRRECRRCGTDIGDHPASHTRCFDCFGRARSAPRRECRGCGTDIRDRPASHSVCLECFRGPKKKKKKKKRRVA